VPIQLGIIKNNLVIKVLKYFEYILYNKASKIVALSPGMYVGVLESGIKDDKVYMVPNMSKPDIFYDRPKSLDVISKYDIKESDVSVIYFGTIGRANGLLKVIEFFNRIPEYNVKLYIAGDGSEVPKVEEFIASNQVSHIKYLGNFSMNMISEITNCCDVSLVSFDDVPILYTNSPNKLFDSLSAEKPIIVNSNGWTRDMVNDYNCGYYYRYDDFKSFISMIENMIQDKKNGEIKVKAKNAWNLSNSKFDKKILTEKIVSIIKECI